MCNLGPLLLIAVVIAFGGSLIGLLLSYYANLPAGPAIVLTLVGALTDLMPAPWYGCARRKVFTNDKALRCCSRWPTVRKNNGLWLRTLSIAGIGLR